MKVGLQHIVQLLRRELVHPELRLMFGAVVVTVSALATVGLFTDRVQRTLTQQSHELLGADLVVSSTREIPDAWRLQAEGLGLRTAQVQEFPSVVLANGRSELVEVKAVSSRYPLRGWLEVRESDDAPASRIQSGPPPGAAWVETRLLDRLGMQLGGQLRLGERQLVLQQHLDNEPDRGSSLFSLAPRVLMHLDDVAATGLIGPGSRLRYRLLIAGDIKVIDRLRDWLAPQLKDHHRLLTVDESRPEVKQSLERAGRFLSLSVLVALILSGLAIWVAVRTWLQRRLIHAAVWRSLGLVRSQVLLLYLGQLLLLVLLACVLAIVLAWGLQAALAVTLREVMNSPLIAPSPAVALLACLVGVLLIMAFTFPAYLRLASVSPMRVLRGGQDRFELLPSSIVLGIVVLAAVFWWMTADARLLLYAAAGFLAALLMLMGLSWLLIVLGRHASARLPSGLRLGLNALVRHRNETVLMMSAYGLSFTFIILLTLVRGDLIDQWRAQLPAETPNTFLINVQPDELKSVERWLASHDIRAVDFYPTARGRLVKINGRDIHPHSYENPRAQRLVQREFNLSWDDRLAAHNKVIEGRWWDTPASADGEWSVEAGIAETLGIRVGDTLVFDAAGEMIPGRVTNLRAVRWDSFKVNFFVTGQPPMFAAQGRTLISSFYVPAEKKLLMRDLVGEFPAITVLDVDALMARVRGIIDRVSVVAEAAFVFTLLAAMLLMISMVVSSRSLREHEVALLRSMGATGRELAQAQRTEFIFIGAGSGLIAVLFSNLLAWAVSLQLLEIPYRFNMVTAGAVVIAGVLLMLVTGGWLLRGLNRQSPMRLLRGA